MFEDLMNIAEGPTRAPANWHCAHCLTALYSLTKAFRGVG